MVWQPYWIYPKTYKKIFFSRIAGQIDWKLHANVPQALEISGYSRIIIDVTWSGNHIGLSENLFKIISLEPLDEST